MRVSEQLRAAKALIADPKNWTRGAFARSAFDNVIGPETEGACKWCAVGALYKVGDVHGRAGNLLWDAAAKIGRGHPALVNDELGHATVLRMFDLAIAKAEAPDA